MFGKLFEAMYDGTLAGHWEAIVTFQQLIVLADADGVVDVTPQAISARTTIPLEIIAKGLEFLALPDPYSRTPGEDGRRIVCIDEHRPWGWQIVNYLKYKNLKDSDEVREQNRVRAQRFRDKRNGASRDVTPSNTESRHTDTDTDTDTKTPVVPFLPNGINAGDWKAFRQHRITLKKRMSTKAEELALAKLKALADQGYDVKKILNLAIESGWLTFYPREDCKADGGRKVAMP